MKEAVTKVIDTLTQEDFHEAFQKLLERNNKCIAAGGDYFEGDKSFMCVLSIKVPIPGAFLIILVCLRVGGCLFVRECVCVCVCYESIQSHKILDLHPNSIEDWQLLIQQVSFLHAIDVVQERGTFLKAFWGVCNRLFISPVSTLAKVRVNHWSYTGAR